jgi:hypothetical protein
MQRQLQPAFRRCGARQEGVLVTRGKSCRKRWGGDAGAEADGITSSGFLLAREVAVRAPAVIKTGWCSSSDGCCTTERYNTHHSTIFFISVDRDAGRADVALSMAVKRTRTAFTFSSRHRSCCGGHGVSVYAAPRNSPEDNKRLQECCKKLEGFSCERAIRLEAFVARERWRSRCPGLSHFRTSAGVP